MQTTQGHRLNEIWAVEDAVSSATQSADIAKQYHQMTAQNVSVFSADIDQLTHRLNHATAQINRLEGLINDSRTHCLVWGIVGAIVSSLVMSLITAQFNPPQNLATQQSVKPIQNALAEPVPQIQKPRTVQAKAKSIKRFTTQKRG